MDNLHGGELIWYIHRKYKIPIEDIICFDNLASPIHPDLPKPSESILKSYSDRKGTKLKELIGDRFKIREENIILTNGSTELIYLVALCFGKKAQIPIPTYSEYELAVEKYGGESYFTENYTPVGANILFICNPNNPTGNLIEKKDLEGIIKEHSPDTKIFLDEAYMKFVPYQKSYSMTASINDYSNLIISQTLTKFYGLPSLRLGWGIASTEIIKKLYRHQIPVNLSGLAVYYAQKFLQNKDYDKKVIELIEKERERLFIKLKEINWLKVHSTYTNYFLLEINGEFSSSELFEILPKRGIIIRDCSNIRGLSNKHFRITIKIKDENDRLIDELKSIEN